METGIRLLDKTMADAKAAGKTEISGKDAFTLYDTFGFPLDLTELILRENGMTADIKEFDAEMQQQKQRAMPPPLKPETGLHCRKALPNL